MDKKQFIDIIAPCVQKIAPEFGIDVCSPIIAQAILESGWGTTDKAAHNNYFGIKYTPGRVPSASGYFSSTSQEQRADGSYYPITCFWCEFPNVEMGVRGYFEFINTDRYKNLKGIKSPEKYLETIRSDGYATSLKYVENLLRVIKDNNLTKYDPKDIVIRSEYAAKGNYGGSRPLTDIKYIVIHYTANDGDTAEGNVKYFEKNIVKASAHYFVDDTSIIQSVPDDYVAWSVGGKKWNDCDQTGGGTLFGIAKNQNTLSIELCDTVKDGTIYPTEKTIQNAVDLTKYLMKKYSVGLDNVIRHFDVNGKHCPAYWMDDNKWNIEFRNRLTGEVTPILPKTYKVQSGAYKSKLIARAEQEKLSKAGIDSFIKMEDGLYKIQCGSFSKKENAEALRTKLQQKGFSAIIKEK